MYGVNSPVRARAGLAMPRLLTSRDGIAAVEFALILPIMLMMLVGLTEYARALDHWRKLTLLTRTMSDLTAQGEGQRPISQTMMNDILGAGSAVLRPFDSSAASIVISAVGVTSSNSQFVAKVCSSVANANASPRPVGPASDLSVPSGFRTAGIRYVLTETSMDYRPMLGSTLARWFGSENGTIRFSMSMPWPARGGRKYGTNPYAEVILPNGAECK